MQKDSEVTQMNIPKTAKYCFKALSCFAWYDKYVAWFELSFKNFHLKVHQSRFENLPISSSSYENNMLKISH